MLINTNIFPNLLNYFSNCELPTAIHNFTNNFKFGKDIFNYNDFSPPVKNIIIFDYSRREPTYGSRIKV